MSKAHQFTNSIRKQTLAEQVAEAIKDSILDGELAEGEGLPTEPALCEQFGVSRAVIRDATRMLMAQGLVDAKQGSGVYVTPAQNPAFGDALLLALRRLSATAWDVEEFEQTLLPHVAALAAVAATAADLAVLQQRLDDYLAYHAEHARTWRGIPPDEVPRSEQDRLAAQFAALMQTIFDATHNKILILLAQPLTMLHGMRHWEGASITAEGIIANEERIMRSVVDAILARDAQQAREAIEAIQRLPDEAIDAMHMTPVGEMTQIRLTEAPDSPPAES